MAYQKLQPERAYTIPSGDNFDISLDNPFYNIKQKLRSANGDFTFGVTSTALTSITMLKNIYTAYLTKLPTVTISSSGGGSASGFTAGTDSDGNLQFTFSASIGTWSQADTVTIALDGTTYKIIPSARVQPFTVYTNDATSLASVYSGAGDSIGTISCSANTMIPFQISAATCSNTKGIIALW